MFEFFPGNYKWSREALFVAEIGGSISEIAEIARSVNSAPEGANLNELFYESWARMGERVEGMAVVDSDAGHELSASRKYLRAALYFVIAETGLDYGDPRRMQVYQTSLRVFARGVECSGRPTEFVDIPFEDTTLPSLFLPAFQADGSLSPAMIHFDGSEDVKELTYMAINHGLADRGVSVLICDHPGSGGGLRLRGLPVRHDIEVAASACVDYLESREDVDSERIGIIAQSLGGYYAPRSAAFEKRLKCCVCWGSLWNWAEHIREREPWYETPHAFLANLFGTDDPEELAANVAKFTLEGIADKIECPILAVHGENDRQVGTWAAEKLVAEAVNSPRRDLRIFTFAEGGVEHCQVDHPTLATDYMYDWIAEVLEANPAAQLWERGREVAR